MKCLHPLYIDNPDENELVKFPQIPVPCGRCENCLVSDAQDWRIRLESHYDSCISASFITLTYSDDKLPFARLSDSFGDEHFFPCVSKRDIQLFFKKLRSYLKEKGYNDKISYFLVSEYGPTTLRPHYHAIIFNLPVFSQNTYLQRVKTSQLIERHWDNGFCKVDSVTEGRISYVTKYVSCVTYLPEYYPKPFRLISKGVGKSYLDKTNLVNWHRTTLSDYVPKGNIKYRMPRYLKDKIFDDDMKVSLHEKKVQFHLEQIEKLASKFSDYEDYKRYVEEQQRIIELRHRKFQDKCVKKRKDI